MNNYVTIEELGASVKKVDNILDININNFNDSYLIDNFKKIVFLEIQI